MNETLIVVTTANHVEYTQKCIDSLTRCDEPFDLLVIDDASSDDTQCFLKQKKINFISKQTPKGLTHSWNLAYQYFLDHSYRYLILANNDILVPNGALMPMLNALEKFTLVGPMTHAKGVFPDLYDAQIVSATHDLDCDPQNPTHYQDIQHSIGQTDLHDYQNVERLNGFFLAMNRSISEYEFQPKLLFNPAFINTRNEDDLCKRVHGNKAVCLKSFIFHYKGVSVSRSMPGCFVPYSILRELTWKQCSHLKNNYLLQVLLISKHCVKSLLEKFNMLKLK